MPEGSGLTKVRNQAFRLLVDALDLPGGVDSLEFMDLDHATAVVEMNPLMQAAVGFRIVYDVAVAVPAASTVQTILDFWDPTSWTNIFSPQSGGNVPEQDWPILLHRIGAISSAGGDLQDCLVRLDSGGAGRGPIPIWLVDTNGAFGENLFRANAPPNLIRFPALIDRRIWDEVNMRSANTGAGAEQVTYRFECYAAPLGFIPQSF